MKYSRNTQGKLVTKASKLKSLPHNAYRAGDAVKIEFGPGKCKFLTGYPKQVYEALAIYVPGHIFIPSVKDGRWDGKKKLITNAGYFQTGLLPVVITMLKRGVNPLVPEDKKNHKVLHKAIEKVQIIVPDKYTKIYYQGLPYYYEDNLDLLQWLAPESGEFTYPTELLKSWIEVRDTNALAPKILRLAKALKK